MINKIRRLITISKEVIDDIEKKKEEGDFNFSSWIEDTYIHSFMTHEALQKRLEMYQQNVKKLENQLNYSVKKRQNHLNNLKKGLNSDERKFTEFSKKILKKSPEKLSARLRCFNNQFKHNLTKQEFLAIMGDEK